MASYIIIVTHRGIIKASHNGLGGFKTLPKLPRVLSNIDIDSPESISESLNNTAGCRDISVLNMNTGSSLFIADIRRSPEIMQALDLSLNKSAVYIDFRGKDNKVLSTKVDSCLMSGVTKYNLSNDKTELIEFTNPVEDIGISLTLDEYVHSIVDKAENQFEQQLKTDPDFSEKFITLKSCINSKPLGESWYNRTWWNSFREVVKLMDD